MINRLNFKILYFALLSLFSSSFNLGVKGGGAVKVPPTSKVQNLLKRGLDSAILKPPLTPLTIPSVSKQTEIFYSYYFPPEGLKSE